MKTVKQLVLMVVAAVVCASAALAGPPLDGQYQSPTFGSPDLLVGRHSESWSSPSGWRASGDAMNAASFDGTTLGTQWSWTCLTQVSHTVTFDGRDANGTGNLIALLFFTTSGSSFSLSGTGAWAGGDASYPGVIENFIVTLTETWVLNVRVGTDETISMSGHFIGASYPCFQWQANGAEVGNTDSAVKPADYPAFLLGFSCLPFATLGSWSNQIDITLDIFSSGCTVAAHDKTWGAIKDLYRD